MSDETYPTNLVRRSSILESLPSFNRLSRIVTGKPIEPSGSWYRRWWFFTTICALATAFFSPWEVAFTDDPGLSPYTDLPAVVEYMLTAVFVTDIFVQLNVAFINPEGRIEFSRKAIATNYLKLMFWIDLIGVIPFNTVVDIFVDHRDGQGRLTLLRLFRLVRAHRLWALSRDFEMNIHLHLMTITLIRNFAIVMVANHWAACAFYYIAREYDFDTDSWIGANLAVMMEETGAYDIPLAEWQKYVYSLYWAITTMTTVGYGDYSPKNISEVVFVMVFMLFNIALNSYILGTITLVVIKADETTSQQRRGYEKLERFACKHRLSDETLKNLKNHLKFNYLHPEVQNSELMVNLPMNLRRKVMDELYGERLLRSPAFQGCSRSFISSLLEPYEESDSPTLYTEVYMTHDEIVTCNEFVSCLYLIISGSAILHQTELSVLDVFPVEPFLDLCNCRLATTEFHASPYTVRANSTCRVLCIPHKTLLRSFRAYPAEKEIFQRAATGYTQKLFYAAPLVIYPAGHHLSGITSQAASTANSAVHFTEDYHSQWPDLESNQAPLKGIKSDSTEASSGQFQTSDSPHCAIDAPAGITQTSKDREHSPRTSTQT